MATSKCILLRNSGFIKGTGSIFCFVLFEFFHNLLQLIVLFPPLCRVPTYRRKQKEVHMTVGLKGAGHRGNKVCLLALSQIEGAGLRFTLKEKGGITASWWPTL